MIHIFPNSSVRNMYIGKIQLFVILCFLSHVKSKCNDTSKNILFISDYVKWRKLNFMILLDDDINSACNLKMVRDNLNMFITKNIYFAAHSSFAYTEATLNNTKEKTAVVTFLDTNFTSQGFLEQANKIARYGERASWLILANCHLQINIMDALRYVNFGLDSDVVVAFDTLVNVSSNQPDLMNNTQFNMLQDVEDTFLPFKNTSNQTINSTITCIPLQVGTNQEMYYLYQVYKIRKHYNTSLVVRPLGVWDYINTTKNLKPFWYLENRGNFHQFPIIIGHYDVDADGPLKESEIDISKTYFVNYLISFFNSSKSFVGFTKLGHREDGEWTDLLDAIIDEIVDISGEGISKTPERINDMTYSFDILKNTRNIYIEPEESEIMRDIFLTPFNSNLIFCVLGTGLILSLAMTINNFVSAKFGPQEAEVEEREISESIVWCVGIFSQQGSIWKTRSLTEKTIVIVALFLTILIYNSYSAFITSVLSVELVSIRSITDVLESDYKIGYAKESQDEDYLRSVNISELKQIYLRGYLQNDISNISEGLIKVTEGNFAFFASSQVARTELWNMTKCRCKFKISEIKIPSTTEYMGILMSKRSTFKRLINLSIIKMYETGVYRYIYSIIYPDLLQCAKAQTFQSAGLADLSTAFFIVIFGWVASFGIMISERVWKNRNKIGKGLKKRITGDYGNITNSNNIQQNDFEKTNYSNMYPKFGGKSNLILPPSKTNLDFLN